MYNFIFNLSGTFQIHHQLSDLQEDHFKHMKLYVQPYYRRRELTIRGFLDGVTLWLCSSMSMINSHYSMISHCLMQLDSSMARHPRLLFKAFHCVRRPQTHILVWDEVLLGSSMIKSHDCNMIFYCLTHLDISSMQHGQESPPWVFVC